jgi:hypothetical protein
MTMHESSRGVSSQSEYEKLVSRIENADEGSILRDKEFAEFIDTERSNHPTIFKVSTLPPCAVSLCASLSQTVAVDMSGSLG